MTTKIQLANSDYNKTDYLKLNVQDARKLVFSEAVIQENDDRMTVYAYVTVIEDKIEVFKQPDYVFQPSICYFDLLKKGYEYKGVKVEPTPGSEIAIAAIQAMEGKPFSGFIDLGKNAWDRDVLLKGAVDGESVPVEMVAFAKKSAYQLIPCELDKLKDLKMAEMKSAGKGGYKGETEQQKLEARLAFIESALKPDSKVQSLIKDIQSKGYQIEIGTLAGMWLEGILK